MSSNSAARGIGTQVTLLGSSQAMCEVRYMVAQVGPSDASVLVTGPSGSGKEVVARLLHQTSPRRAEAFVTLNCGAIPGELIESELFGHEKGAFTGAANRREGRFEAAHAGTIFLDEIGDMPVDMQVKLLRVLEERRFERVGGNASIAVDTRVVSATHRALEEGIQKGTFREDLFYRLNIFPVRLPALAQRSEDVPELLEHFAKAHGGGEAAFALDAGALDLLVAYAWPGNVRELRNFAERAAILYRGQALAAGQAQFLLGLGRAAAMTRSEPAAPITPVSVPQAAPSPARMWPQGNVVAFPEAKIAAAPPAVPEVPQAVSDPAEILAKGSLKLRDLLADIETSFIRTALERCDYTVADAARLLGLQRTTLCEKMRKYDIRRPDGGALDEEDRPAQRAASR